MLKSLAFWLAIGALFYLKVFNPIKTFEKVVVINEIKTLENTQDAELKEVRTVQALVRFGFRFAEVVFFQILLETDRLRSKVYKECNNVVGMKWNERGYAIGTCRGHAQYARVKDCLLDYLEYQQTYLTYYEEKIIHRSCLTNDDYYNFLLWIGYAEDSEYIEKLKFYELIFKQHNKTWNNS